MRQEIYGDDYGIDTWQAEPASTVHIDLVDALAFEALSRLSVPRPVDAATYTDFGLPWFVLLDPTGEDIEAAARLRSVRSIADLEGRRETPLPIPEEQVARLLRLRAPTA